MSDPRDDFFVGYLPEQPRSIARRVRAAVLAVAAGALALGALLVAAQRPYADSHFAYDREQEFSGTLSERPAPMLWTATPTSPSGHLLVAPGKHGAGMLVSGLEGRNVTLRGKLIWRGGLESRAMIEIVPGSIQALSSPGAGAPTEERLGRVRLQGEIVDGKCYLGVMNPGEGKVHRDCAARCIAGGAPPLLAVADGPPHGRLVSLAGSRGESIAAQLLEFVAEPVTIEGELIRHGDHYSLYADPGTLRRGH
jgi:hypothetical protein